VIGGADSQYMGWGFNLTIASPWVNGNTSLLYTPTQIGNITTSLLNSTKIVPLFNSGYVFLDSAVGPSWIGNLFNDSTGSSTAATNYNQLLAEAIPALSLPVGANLVTNIPHLGSTNQEFNMPAAFVPNTSYWPRSPIGGVAPWFHTDMQAMAYPYLYKFYDQLVTISKQ
jgi:hypothetical protein